jgi:hypothetical protein
MGKFREKAVSSTNNIKDDFLFQLLLRSRSEVYKKP